MKTYAEYREFFEANYGVIPLADIGTHIGMCTSSVTLIANRLRKQGANIRPTAKVIAAEKVDKYLPYFLEHYGKKPSKEIAKHFNIHHTTVTSIASKLRQKRHDIPKVGAKNAKKLVKGMSGTDYSRQVYESKKSVVPAGMYDDYDYRIF